MINSSNFCQSKIFSLDTFEVNILTSRLVVQNCAAYQLVGISEQNRLHRNSRNECTCNHKLVLVLKAELYTAIRSFKRFTSDMISGRRHFLKDQKNGKNFSLSITSSLQLARCQNRKQLNSISGRKGCLRFLDCSNWFSMHFCPVVIICLKRLDSHKGIGHFLVSDMDLST